ncbi:peptidoglycan/xylan/chitin deacetylase (PgdA/CDA1 family) [Ancylobacter sp. 3268]|uniref:polysaccharide deacetylase family protein n=1 Tax=Ancylobacter sp. 3268 TaxID=2817752 RepID=UPI00286709E6|nr:polysaccharide deacetylase family protein [Ancylobacter sp. 3268]MDR6955394.1 peptidoglycan/xylan/chitin deacetylase (PgdA/CDA1 family) [Ancylobacter sp. 3268]
MSAIPLATHGRYRFSAIKDRPTYRWPNGAGLAVYVAVGVEEYSFGEGLTEDLFPGASKPDLVNASWRDYGNRVGAFRLFDRLASFGIRPAVLLNTAVYDHAPAVIAAAREIGAEFVAHGVSNSDTLAGMNPQEETAYLRAVVERITREEGGPPAGWSSPWLAHSPATLDLLAAEGFEYVADFRMDDQPVWLATQAGRLLSMPYALELNDSTTIIGRQASARDFAEMIVDEFDEMLEASRTQPLVMSVVVHSFISGQPFRLRALTRALEHIAARKDAIWLARPRDIATWAGERMNSGA